MPSLFEQLTSFFEALGWPVQQVPDHPILSITWKGRNGQWVFVASAAEEHRILTVFSRAPITCPPERIGAMCDWIVRANFGMTHGCFDMDHADGEIRYRTGVDLVNLEIDAAFFKAVALYNLASMDTYLPAIRAVVEEGVDPEEALARLDRD